MLILGYVIFSFFYNFYDKELIKNRINSLKSMQIAFDTLINEMNSNAYGLLSTQEFSTSYLSEGYGNYYDVIKRLSRTMSNNSFISDVFYINSNLGYIVTPTRMCNYDIFTEYDSGYNIPPQEMESVLLQDKKMYWIPVQSVNKLTPKDVLTYIVTNKGGSTKQDMSIFYQIDLENIDKLAGNYMSISDSCIVIADTNNRILYSSNEDISNIAWEEWKNKDNKSMNQPIKMKINNQTFIVLQNASQASPITYVNLIPYQAINRPIESYKLLFFICLFVTVILSSIFIFFFMKINYVPIYSLSRLVSTLFGDISESNSDELEGTRRVLVGIQQSNFILMREKITLKLIRGGYSSLLKLEEDGSKVKYPLGGPFFRIINFNISGNRTITTDKYQEIAVYIENTFNIYLEACAINYSENNSVIVVLSGIPGQLNAIDEKLIQIRNVVENAFQVSLSIGVGNIAEIDKMIDTYTQALISSKYKLVKGLSSISYYKDIESESCEKLIYPAYEIEALYDAILAGEEEKIRFITETLLKHMSITNNLFFATCLAYDIVNTALKAMREMNYSFSSFNYKEFLNIGVLNSQEEIVHIINLMVVEIVELISTKEESNNNSEEQFTLSKFEQIMKYISEHFNEEDISVKSLADRFDMSVSNFSHYFKKHTGESVSNYISILRLERAKELLRKTDMNLQDVAANCGYLHLSTFMRQFKSHESSTPSSYRSKYRG